MKRLFILLSILLLAVFFLIAAALYGSAVKRRSPAGAAIDIAPGSSVQGIAKQLTEAGVIRAPKLFEVVVRMKGAGGKLRAGPYEFPAGTTMLSAIDRIARGDVLQWPFTIVEGWTVGEIAAALSGKPFLADDETPAEFARLAASPEFSSGLGFEGARSLEGYLFPDTYFLTRPTKADALAKRLVARFRDVWRTLDAEAIRATGLDEKQIVTLASIVEKETGAGEERPLVASVFFNRLRLGMPLQSDPTIIYGLANYDGNIRKADISNPHPYNTYVHAGLPPGPICNPGRASLEAVINPAKSDYLYFVAKKDGTHHFSKTLAEHSEAVRRYQLMR